MEVQDWYSNREAWPFILVASGIRKNMGYPVVLYYAVLIGDSKEYYETAEIDGANKLQQIRYDFIQELLTKSYR